MIRPMVNGAGAAQQTTAAQMILSGLNRGTRSGPRRRKSRAASARATPARRRKRAAGARKRSAARPARLVKGSAAAKRYMASIRRKRKR